MARVQIHRKLAITWGTHRVLEKNKCLERASFQATGHFFQIGVAFRPGIGNQNGERRAIKGLQGHIWCDTFENNGRILEKIFEPLIF